MKREWLINYECFSKARVVRWLRIVRQLILNKKAIFSPTVQSN